MCQLKFRSKQSTDRRYQFKFRWLESLDHYLVAAPIIKMKSTLEEIDSNRSIGGESPPLQTTRPALIDTKMIHTENDDEPCQEKPALKTIFIGIKLHGGLWGYLVDRRNDHT